MPGPIRWQVDGPSLTSERHALWRSVVPDMIAAADEGSKVGLASPWQHQDLWTSSKGNLTSSLRKNPFRPPNQPRKLLILCSAQAVFRGVRTLFPQPARLVGPPAPIDLL